MRKVVRFTGSAFQQVKTKLRDPTREGFAFALCRRVEGREAEVFLPVQVLLPDEDELREQSAARVGPSRRFQSFAYFLAELQQLSVLDIHTHLGTGPVSLSGIDRVSSEEDACYFAGKFPASMVTGGLVFDQSFLHFDGLIQDRQSDRLEPVAAVEVLGSPMLLLERRSRRVGVDRQLFSRQLLVPGWKQELLERMHVVVAGCGGLGAVLLEVLMGMGVGRKGSIVVCDPDDIELSNLPRLPFASVFDVGRAKVDVAARYAASRGYMDSFVALKLPVQHEEVRSRAREAHLLVGAVDSEDARKTLNEYALRDLVPYMDLGTEILVEGGKPDSGGQVRIVLPGETGCLVCCGGIDLARAAQEAMSEEDRARYREAGYVRGTQESPAAAVTHLNGVVANLAASQLTKLVFGDEVQRQTYLVYQQERNELTAARSERVATCPACGPGGFLGRGDEQEEPLSMTALPAALQGLVGTLDEQEEVKEEGSFRPGCPSPKGGTSAEKE